MECEVIRLSNGLRVAFQEDTSIHTIHCGFVVNAGSRDEDENEHGIAHLVEHCLFKGTKKRRAFHILSRLDSVGGEINAFTTKEETCVYASALKEHFERASELLVDILFSASFPQKEVIKELSVIRDEINSYKDSPDDMLLDEFEERLFPDHALGRNILGSEENVSKLSREHAQNFVEKLYATNEIVFACVGNIKRSKFLRFCKKSLEQIPMRHRSGIERNLPHVSSFNLDKRMNVHQVHSIIGGSTIGMNDEDSKVLVLLNNILGGPALNSLLNMNIRERLGFCYYIESSYNPYSDIGLFQIYFGTDASFEKKTLKLVRKEMDKLMNKKLTSRALTLAKQQLLGQMALGQEQRSNLMLSSAKSLLHFDIVDSFSTTEAKLNEINEADIQNMARKVFDPQRLNRLAYLPSKL